MPLTRRIARPLIAGMFVAGGIDALQNPEAKAERATPVTDKVSEPLGFPSDPVTLVRLNGAVMVVGGLMFASGKLPRLSAVALAATLVPTTLAGHRFWEFQDAQLRAQQRIHFLKNMSMLGGLVLAATDTEGRPSLSWRAGQRARRALDALPTA
jgi:uncharacterized membrane protein YphA (DoxX/SURF4 family)